MGGIGSGNREQTARQGIVETHCALDVREFHRAGCLQPGIGGVLNRPFGGSRIAALEWTMQGNDNTARAVLLRYTVGHALRSGADIHCRIPIVYTRCHYGGFRPWFRCPGISGGRVCNRRVAVLYLGARSFCCRHCHRLVYESQRETSAERALRRANKIRQRLGGDPGASESFPDKPSAMHWATYRRLQERVYAAEWEDE